MSEGGEGTSVAALPPSHPLTTQGAESVRVQNVVCVCAVKIRNRSC